MIPNNQGTINISSASKTKYNKPIIKYCKSKLELKPKGSNPHSYWDVFSKKFKLKLKLNTTNHKKQIKMNKTPKYKNKKEYSSFQ